MAHPVRRDVAPIDVQTAVELLARGEVVAFPTETFYGLGADARCEQAVRRVRALKARDDRSPIAVIVGEPEMLDALCAGVPAAARDLAAAHWPGALTLVLTARPGLAPSLLGAASEVGLRVPSHPVARDLARRFGGPVTATSANRSGDPPARTAAAVRATFGDELPVVDGGDTPGAPASTVVRFDGERPIIVRQGAVAIDA
ncbi:MAG: L-threonylcarbamoyladenylate synthase [Myxococcota bacterium]